jgi:hypothetical protein
MRRLLSIPLLLLSLACRENPSPESQAVTTAAAPAAPAAPAASAPPIVAGPKLLPVDEASGDPSFAAYRDELLAAVRRRDATAVAALADPKIRTSFGGGGGADDLRRTLEQPGMWDDLEQLLTQGGSFRGEGTGRSFWAPYVYSAWPDAHDPFEFLAITGKDVPLRESQDPGSPTIATLSYDIVERAGEPGNLRHVKTADGKTGWVEAHDVRSPIGYRAGFLKSDGKWRMNALVSGD